MISNFLDMQCVKEKFSSCAERRVKCSLSECISPAWSVIAARVRSIMHSSSRVEKNTARTLLKKRKSTIGGVLLVLLRPAKVSSKDSARSVEA